MLLSLSSYGLEELTESGLENVKLGNDDLEADCSGEYCGEISFCVDNQGILTDAILTRPSGNKNLDSFHMKYFSNGVKIEAIPMNACFDDQSNCCSFAFLYDESGVDPAILEATNIEINNVKVEFSPEP